MKMQRKKKIIKEQEKSERTIKETSPLYQTTVSKSRQ